MFPAPAPISERGEQDALRLQSRQVRCVPKQNGAWRRNKMKVMMRLVLLMVVVFIAIICLLCRFFDVKNVCQILLTFASFVAMIGGVRALFDWKNQRAEQSARFMCKLIDRFSNNMIREILVQCDMEGGLEEWFEQMDDETAKQTEKAFRFFTYVCYLSNNRLIDKQTFGLFDAQLSRILLDKSTVKYLNKEANRMLSSDVKSANPFTPLFQYAENKGIPGYKLAPEDVDASSLKTTIKETDFTEPTLIIRINRLYRNGMSKNELYDATRGWWRVQYEKVKDCKIALAVAGGIVREVYKIKEWRDKNGNVLSKGSDINGRLQFEGDVATDAIRDKFFKRSVEGLFKQGDAYPVRYLGVKA